ncbi:MAG: serine hydrolase domain-containing protein, partial [Caulobacter sp.]
MKLKVYAVAATVLASTLTSPFADAREEPQKPMSKPQADALRLIDVWLESEQAYRRIPAMSAAIVQGDKTVFLTGYGTLDADHTVPATGQTLYSICSISKLFASVALMQQWEGGKVRLDEPVTTYLPWAKLKSLGQDSAPVTLRTLLTHSSGLPRDFDKPYWVGPDFTFPTDAEVKATLPGQTPLWPASRWMQYSNVGLTLVGDTVQAVTATPYADYVKSQVLEPLGMNDTSLGLPMALYGKRLAVGWGSIDRQGRMELLKPFDTRAVAPAAGYVSSAEDLSRFAQWQFRLLASEKAELLKASTLRDMQRVQFLDPDWSDSWGLGFRVWRASDKTYVGHDGACPGYKTALTLRPSTETAVVVMMTGMLDASARTEAVFELLDKRKAAEADKS